MGTWGVVACVLVFVLVDFVVIGAVVSIAAQSVGELARRFPSKTPGPGAVSKRFQSVKVGMLSLGGSVHLAVDESHLHVEPALIMRRFGMRGFSVPWSEVVFVRRGWRSVRVRIADVVVIGPPWALELASPGDGVNR